MIITYILPIIIIIIDFLSAIFYVTKDEAISYYVQLSISRMFWD